MRKLIILTVALISLQTFQSFAQNTFPSNGSAGIGTINPETKLHVLGAGNGAGTGASQWGYELIKLTGTNSYPGMSFSDNNGYLAAMRAVPDGGLDIFNVDAAHWMESWRA